MFISNLLVYNFVTRLQIVDLSKRIFDSCHRGWFVTR